MSARHRKCPTPEKVKYATVAAAAKALLLMRSGRLENRCYRCKGHYHLTKHTGRRAG